MITFLANPKAFLDFSNAISPWLAGLAFLLLGPASIGLCSTRRPITSRDRA
jgi:hypothetical protein